jgi:photosynthetic reaction center H subunit
MPAGYITSYFDVAQITLYAFWFFFAGLIWYLKGENRREGFPLVSDLRGGGVIEPVFPPLPAPKAFIMAHGQGTVLVPRPEEPPQPVLNAAPIGLFPGAPLQPLGNPMLDGIGPAAYALRADEPDRLFETGEPKIVPLRSTTDFFLAPQDPDPRGMEVVGGDGVVAGRCVDAWPDRSETLIRYIEVEVAASAGTKHVLVPMTLADIDAKRRRITVDCVLARHFADAPTTRHPEIVTHLEEERICAYFASGYLYARPTRLGPLL